VQSAADEDANIIFGAVLDEKMKDSVKITVIATGFRDSEIPRRRPEMKPVFISSRETNDFPEPEPESDPLPPPPPMVMEEAGPQPVASTPREVTGIDAMRDAMIANFEQSDLDVPAFLRRRGETQ
jgi:cell division protein FtsZ